ncbi:DNA repair protein [Ascodesmis nigricans]|uniref:DNA repair protein RAD14 n=1 Tax=Ascodesmis nigricans TaxID=341454 RepID=A0A4S2N1W9_9PEZI|nr:DNA repair protein [Ascodesmis nigricans]
MASSTPRSSAPPPPPPPPPKPTTQLTPDQIRRIETNRLRAKSLRSALAHKPSTASSQNAPPTGTKRPAPSSRIGGTTSTIQPAKKFTKFVDYDLSKMTDTHGGFLSTTDDPHSILSSSNLRDKPAGMSLEDWSRHQLRVKMQHEKAGIFEPGISALELPEEQKLCWECGSPEIDWKWREVFACRVCEKCKRERPEKYSLLTKTECREDYMLTEPELKDKELLPYMEQPNPHKSTWSNMMLYMRYQVEAVAIKKWGSLEAMDAEYQRRTEVQKKRKEQKFTKQLRELKKKTRVDAWKRERQKESVNVKHEHVWGAPVTRPDGETVTTCEECGFEVEELVI